MTENVKPHWTKHSIRDCFRDTISQKRAKSNPGKTSETIDPPQKITFKVHFCSKLQPLETTLQNKYSLKYKLIQQRSQNIFSRNLIAVVFLKST